MSDDAEKPLRDYRETVFLPETPFPMRAGLPTAEPKLLERLGDLYPLIRADRQATGAPLFVLHDGPPYANGAIHIGHALNKILKDFVVRSRFALGYDVDYVPGWDCHGLPIEWKIEEELGGEGRKKGEVSKAEFRAALPRVRRALDPRAEPRVPAPVRARRLGPSLLDDGLHQRGGDRRRVPQVHRHPPALPRRQAGDVEPGGAHRAGRRRGRVPRPRQPHDLGEVPGDRRAAGDRPSRLGGDLDDDALDHPRQPGDRLQSRHRLRRLPGRGAGGEPAVRAVGQSRRGADPRREAGDRGVRGGQGRQVAEAGAGRPAGHGLRPPAGRARRRATAFACRCWPAIIVTDEAGTGFVHTAPGHGAEDYQIWLAHGHREIPETVDEDGAYEPDVPLFAGLKVLETEGKRVGKFGPANDAVIKALIEAGTLLARGRLEHSYPHSWRSKAPVIYRATPQWFVRDRRADRERGPRRQDAARDRAAARSTRPPSIRRVSRNRIRSMVETRPDWLVSRQRAWGSPLAMFVDKDDRPAAARRPGQRAHRQPDRRRGRRRLVHPARRATSSATTTPSATRRSRTSSTSGSTRARPTPSCWRTGRTLTGRPTSTSRAPTSTAAGSSRRCWRAAPPAAARPTTR